MDRNKSLSEDNRESGRSGTADNIGRKLPCIIGANRVSAFDAVTKAGTGSTWDLRTLLTKIPRRSKTKLTPVWGGLTIGDTFV